MTRTAIHSADASLPEATPARRRSPSNPAVDLLLKCVLAELPPECRLAFTLSHFDGLPHSQVAARMGISAKQVEEHIRDVLMAVRAALR